VPLVDDLEIRRQHWVQRDSCRALDHVRHEPRHYVVSRLGFDRGVRIALDHKDFFLLSHHEIEAKDFERSASPLGIQFCTH
jgi:hypothetical protein